MSCKSITDRKTVKILAEKAEFLLNYDSEQDVEWVTTVMTMFLKNFAKRNYGIDTVLNPLREENE